MLPMLASLRVGPRGSAPALRAHLLRCSPDSPSGNPASRLAVWAAPWEFTLRPKGFYAVFIEGRVARIAEGVTEAQAIGGPRAYRRFADRTDAEEFAAWWNHERDLETARVHAAIRERLANAPQ